MISKCCAIILPPTQPPEKKKSYKELREEQLAAEAAAKKAAEQPEVRKVQSGKKYALTPTFHFEILILTQRKRVSKHISAQLCLLPVTNYQMCPFRFVLSSKYL